MQIFKYIISNSYSMSGSELIEVCTTWGVKCLRFVPLRFEQLEVCTGDGYRFVLLVVSTLASMTFTSRTKQCLTWVILLAHCRLNDCLLNWAHPFYSDHCAHRVPFNGFSVLCIPSGQRIWQSPTGPGLPPPYSMRLSDSWEVNLIVSGVSPVPLNK